MRTMCRMLPGSIGQERRSATLHGLLARERLEWCATDTQVMRMIAMARSRTQMSGARGEPRRSPATMTAGQTSPAHCPRACPIMWRWLRAVVCAGELFSLTALPRQGPLHPSLRTLMTRRARRTRTWRRSAAAVTWGRAGGAWTTVAPRTLRARCHGTCLATCLLVRHCRQTAQFVPCGRRPCLSSCPVLGMLQCAGGLCHIGACGWALHGVIDRLMSLPATPVWSVACQSWAPAHRPGRSCQVEGGPAGARGGAVQRARRRPGCPHLRHSCHRPDPGAQPWRADHATGAASPGLR